MADVRPNMLHQVYIQSLLSRRSMPADIAVEMYKRAVGVVQKHDDEFEPLHAANTQGFASFLGEVSRLLEPMGLIVKKGFTEDTGKQWVALCNSESGPISQLATDLTPLEISYVRELINAIVGSYPDNSVGSRAALGLTKDLQGQMAKSTAQQLLAALVSRGWFAKSKRGRYSLGTRGLLELDHYLREEFDDMNDCKRCSRLMFTGVACLNNDCKAHLHKYCYKQLQRSGAPCPGCHGDLNDFSQVGEGAVPTNQDDWNSANRKRRARPSGAQDGEEEDELEDDTQGGASMEVIAIDDEEEETQPRSQRAKRR